MKAPLPRTHDVSNKRKLFKQLLQLENWLQRRTYIGATKVNRLLEVQEFGRAGEVAARS